MNVNNNININIFTKKFIIHSIQMNNAQNL